MKMSLDCIPCIVRQTLDAARQVSGEPVIQEEIVREVLRLTGEAAFPEKAAVLIQRIYRRLRTLAGGKDPYREAKDRHNHMAANLLPKLKAELDVSSDPLALAVKLAIAANIIDLGAKSGYNTNEEILESLHNAAHEPLCGDIVSFKAAVANADKILYLADNAGEVVFDRLLIEQLPPGRITLAVRGGPIINDATMADAQYAGLDKIVPVIDNGSDAPGTILNDCSEVFRRSFEQADLVIAKGQGNFETLSDSPHNIYFLFKVKCPIVSGHAGLPVGTHALVRR